MPRLRAMRGRVILRFPEPVKKVGSIHVPEKSQLRPEFGEIVDVGEASTADEEKTRRDLIELMRAGRKIAVSFASGVRFWRDEDAQALGDGGWSWLRDCKAYRIGELSAYVEED